MIESILIAFLVAMVPVNIAIYRSDKKYRAQIKGEAL